MNALIICIYGRSSLCFELLLDDIHVQILVGTEHKPTVNEQQIPALYLYEFVSLLQAVPQLPLLPLPVLSVALPRSFGLLLLLLSLPQLLPSVSELSCQRRHRLTVTFLLTLAKKTKESLEI